MSDLKVVNMSSRFVQGDSTCKICLNVSTRNLNVFKKIQLVSNVCTRDLRTFEERPKVCLRGLKVANEFKVWSG